MMLHIDNIDKSFVNIFILNASRNVLFILEIFK